MNVETDGPAFTFAAVLGLALSAATPWILMFGLSWAHAGWEPIPAIGIQGCFGIELTAIALGASWRATS